MHKETTPIFPTIRSTGSLYLPHQLSNKEVCLLFTPKVYLKLQASSFKPFPAHHFWHLFPQVTYQAGQWPTWVQPLAIGQWSPWCWQGKIPLRTCQICETSWQRAVQKNCSKTVKNNETNCNKDTGLGFKYCLCLWFHFLFFSSLPLPFSAGTTKAPFYLWERRLTLTSSLKSHTEMSEAPLAGS